MDAARAVMLFMALSHHLSLPMAPLNSGSMLGPYELLVRLGRGGMASVWVGRESHGADERLLAIKAMLPELARDSNFRAMFLEEGQIIRSIDHPHVVKVHAVGEDAGVLFMAMEWVEGDSLRALIQEARRRRPIPAEIAVKVIADAAAGLHAAHELRGWDGELRNVVHCDVSPHNILVGIDGRAKIVDFGVANARLHADADADEKVKGKFAYMSPEQAAGARVDRRSDVFALGIVLFELTTGERLFRGETPAHTLSLVTTGVIPDPRSIRADYPPGLAAIALRALERDPSRRFQTAAQLRDALERYLVQERTLVSHASVAKLVGRVLGSRIEQLRQNLRETLVARDGSLHANLIPDKPAAIGTLTGELPALSHRLSAYSGTPRPQSYEPPPPSERSGSSWPPLIAALVGITAAATSIIWALNRPAPSRPLASTLSQPVPGQEQPARDGASPPDPARSGVDIASIPLGAAAPRASGGAIVPAVGRGARVRATRPSASPREEEPIVLAEELPPAAAGTPGNTRLSATAEPEAVVLEESAPEPPRGTAAPSAAAAPSVRGPFSRGAAMAQLGSVSARAATCKRPNGPTGGGRATVTFLPDGQATSVVLGAPFAGTPVGQCVTSAFQSARVPAFTGTPVTLPWSFRVNE